MENKKDIVCNAIRAIDSEWVLNMIAHLIYNITNRKQNGESKSARAAEIVQGIL